MSVLVANCAQTMPAGRSRPAGGAEKQSCNKCGRWTQTRASTKTDTIVCVEKKNHILRRSGSEHRTSDSSRRTASGRQRQRQAEVRAHIARPCAQAPLRAQPRSAREADLFQGPQRRKPYNDFLKFWPGPPPGRTSGKHAISLRFR